MRTKTNNSRPRLEDQGGYNRKLINIACLDREPFAQILAGQKTTEYRRRKRRDVRLEAVTSGERLVLLERGSKRGIKAIVSGKRITKAGYGRFLYSISFRDPKRFDATGIRHLQGWIRREKLSSLKSAALSVLP
jgi:hypothetical protein